MRVPARDACAGAVGDLFGEQADEELVVGPLFGGRSRLELLVFASDRGEVQALEERGQLERERVHQATSSALGPLRRAAVTALTVKSSSALQRAKAARMAAAPWCS